MYTPAIDPSNLPTMYDLPSEEVGEPGLPDEFHRLQAELMEKTYQPERISRDRCLIASDLNLYYDPENTRFYKRPDWFLALNVAHGERQEDLRWSYVTWHAPPLYLVVEFLSPGTEAEDLGQTVRDADKPPVKWDVYERFLQIPYYAVYDCYSNNFRLFRLQNNRYQAVNLLTPRFWFPELDLGLGVWDGVYERWSGLWLRWYDRKGWIPTPEERAETEQQRAEQERQRAEQERQRAEQEWQRAEQERQRAEQEREEKERLGAYLRSLGLDPDRLPPSP
jgi:Uma2 family endonuclease